MLRFADPKWLWGLLMLVPLYWLVLRDEANRRRLFAFFADRGLWRVVAPEIDPSARLRKAWTLACVFVLTVVALARPQWGTHEESVKTQGLDVMVVLDVSNSMLTEDVVPSRLQKARHVIRTLSEGLRGDRVGVVAFAASSYLACPLTTDIDYVIETVQYLGPKMIANQGTDLGIGLETAQKALQRGAQDGPSPSRVVVLISDGEDHEGQGVDAARKLKDSGARLYVLGVGTQKGGPIPLRDDDGNLITYKKDRRGQPIVSTFHPDDLMRVAAAGDGRYWNVTTDEAEVGQLLTDMGALHRSDIAERKLLVHEDRYQYPLALAVLLAFLELGMPARKLEGAATIALILILGLVAGTSEARAAPIETYIDNQQGLQKYRKGELEDAKQAFGSAQARDPSLPELKYNEGVVQLKEGEAEAAARSFEEAYQAASGQSKTGLAARSLFNLGAALAKKGDMKGAMQAYLKSLPIAGRTGDAQLDADARKNIQLLQQQQQQQKKQQQKDQKNQQGQKDQKQQGGEGKQKDQAKNQDGSGDKKDDKNGQDKSQPQRYQQTSQDQRQQSFQSKKLSSDDAERVMEELTGKERELQARIKKQHAGSESNPQDW